MSNVLRGTGSVSDRRRARVLESIAALGYRPNATARNLVRQRSEVLGVLAGISAMHSRRNWWSRSSRPPPIGGFTILVCTTGRHPEDEANRIAALLEQPVAGIVMLQFSGDRGLMTQLLAERVPFVMVSCWDDHADCVAVDDYAGLELAVGHLADLGHRRIAYVTDEMVESPTRRVRLEAFERALLRHGVEFHPDWVIHGGVGVDADASHRLTELLQREDHVGAIVTTNDHMAINLIEQLESSGRRVPDDVSIVGFDGSRIGAHHRIGLTTVAQPVEQLASSSLDLLLESVLGEIPAERRHVRLEPKLIVRASTAVPSGAQPAPPSRPPER